MVSHLTLLAWPPDASPEDRALALVEAVGLAPRAAEDLAALPTPIMAARLDDAIREDVLAALRARGVACFACDRASMESVPEAVQILSLTPAVGAPEPMYSAGIRSRDAEGFRARDIVLLVRGTTRITTTTHEVDPNPSSGYTPGYGGEFGLAAGMMGDMIGEEGAGSVRSTRTKLRQLLDISLRDGRRLRVDATRFAFLALGGPKAYSDNEHIDRLAVRLAEEAPRAIVDTGYKTHKLPMLVQRRSSGGALSSSTTTDDSRSFEFYSAWRWLCLKVERTGNPKSVKPDRRSDQE
jgi:hypothetical protein